ncbi:hypothetical protein GCM10023321_50590 [Pseudonocardia eucalypti]|uniref:Uncharacterized protein n=1 Tax=Pseudonocardia eucalypti TaxID=648755 RepID=A0ABP9QKP4_9PSEU
MPLHCTVPPVGLPGSAIAVTPQPPAWLSVQVPDLCAFQMPGAPSAPVPVVLAESFAVAWPLTWQCAGLEQAAVMLALLPDADADTATQPPPPPMPPPPESLAVTCALEPVFLSFALAEAVTSQW